MPIIQSPTYIFFWKTALVNDFSHHQLRCPKINPALPGLISLSFFLVF